MFEHARGIDTSAVVTHRDLKQISQAAANHDTATAKTATKQLIQDATKVKTADTALTSGLRLPTQ